MIRQAHTYLVGAMGGATLIAIAIAVFVVLVSAQVLRDWPIAALAGGNDGDAEVSNAQPAAPPASAGQSGAADGRRAAEDGTGARKGAGEGANATPGLTASGGGLGSNPGAGTTEPGTGGGGQTGGPAGSPQGGGAPSGGGASGSGSGTGGGGKPTGGGSSSSPSSQVTSTVNDTVKQVDESALGGSGVTPATEGVVEGVAGPESPVGKVVDEAVGTVGGVLGTR